VLIVPFRQKNSLNAQHFPVHGLIPLASSPLHLEATSTIRAASTMQRKTQLATPLHGVLHRLMLTLSKYQANGETVILLHVQCQSLYVRLDVNTCGLEMLCATTTATISRATLTAATV
jgi:hypothetical protein